ADEEISVDELYELVRGAYNFSDLSRVQLENVLDMLAGRYPSDEFAELRPRIVWDRTAGVIRGRGGARQLAVTNAGTIPDRGLYGVHLVDGGGRVGELDEEMVYEARAGQTFMLGASTWRIEEITRDRVVVERFRDEIGDWRVCILTPFGARVHAPWSLALGARLRDSLGLEAQSLWSDDGIAVHLPDADAPPPTEELIVDPDEIEELVMA